MKKSPLVAGLLLWPLGWAAACGSTTAADSVGQTVAADEAEAGLAGESGAGPVGGAASGVTPGEVAMASGGSSGGGSTGETQSAETGNCEQTACPCEVDDDCPTGPNLGSYVKCLPMRCGEASICRYGYDNASPGNYRTQCSCGGSVEQVWTSSPWPQVSAYTIATEYQEMSGCDCDVGELCELSVCDAGECDPDAGGSLGSRAEATGLPYDDDTWLRVIGGTGNVYCEAQIRDGEVFCLFGLPGTPLHFLVDEDSDGFCSQDEVLLPYARKFAGADWVYTLHFAAEPHQCRGLIR